MDYYLYITLFSIGDSYHIVIGVLVSKNSNAVNEIAVNGNNAAEGIQRYNLETVWLPK